VSHFGDLERDPVHNPVRGIAEDFTIWMWNSPTGIKAYLTYAKDLFTEPAALALLSSFKTLIEQLPLQFDSAIDAIKLSDETSRQQLDTWNATEAPYDRAATV